MLEELLLGGRCLPSHGAEAVIGMLQSMPVLLLFSELFVVVTTFLGQRTPCIGCTLGKRLILGGDLTVLVSLFTTVLSRKIAAEDNEGIGGAWRPVRVFSVLAQGLAGLSRWHEETVCVRKGDGSGRGDGDGNLYLGRQSMILGGRWRARIRGDRFTINRVQRRYYGRR